MKIALVSHSLSNFSGVGKVVNELARCCKREHEVHLFAPMGETCEDGYNFHPVPIIKLSWETRNLSFFFRSGIMLRREHFDIVHLHTPSWYKAGIITCHGLPRIGMELIKGLDERYRKEVSIKYIIRNKLSYPLSDYNYRRGRYRKIIALSKEIRHYLKKLYNVPENDIELLPNGVDLVQYNPGNNKNYRDIIRRKHDISGNDFLFFFIGNYYKRKGLAFAMEALARINKPHVKLIVVGRDMADQNRFEQYAGELRIEKQVIFAGQSDRTEYYYAASDAFLFPSFYDCYPLVNLEAMASGLPIITSMRTGTIDIIEDGVNGLIVSDPTNIGELSEKMQLLLDNPQLRQSMSLEAGKTMERYSWENMADQTLSIYKKMF